MNSASSDMTEVAFWPTYLSRSSTPSKVALVQYSHRFTSPAPSPSLATPFTWPQTSASLDPHCTQPPPAIPLAWPHWCQSRRPLDHATPSCHPARGALFCPCRNSLDYMGLDGNQIWDPWPMPWEPWNQDTSSPYPHGFQPTNQNCQAHAVYQRDIPTQGHTFKNGRCRPVT